MHVCICVCDDIKASSSQGFAMCPESFDMSRCIIKTLPHARFPVPDTTAILTLVVISSLLYSVSPPYLTYVLQRGEKSIPLLLLWPFLGSWDFRHVSVSQPSSWIAWACDSFPNIFFLFFLPFFLLWPDGGIQSSSH